MFLSANNDTYVQDWTLQRILWLFASVPNFMIFRNVKIFRFKVARLTNFTFFAIFRFRRNKIYKFYFFSDFCLRYGGFTNSAFSDFSLASTIFRSVLQFSQSFLLLIGSWQTEASRLADFTNFAKFRSHNDFSRCVAIFRCLLSC